MALTQVTGPYPIFTDLDGTPLDDGYLYIGDVNQDPEQNPIQVYWDSNLTIAATQPIRTSNGYAYRNGTPALLYTGGEFSITIRNKREEFVLYSPVGYGFDPAAVSASVVKNDFTGDGVEVDFVLSASPSTILATNIFINGVYQEKDSYSLSGNTITFTVAPPLSSSIEVMTNETGIINAGNATAISYTLTAPGATAQTVQTKLEQYVSVKDFGAVGDGIADDTAAVQACLTYCSGSGATAYFPAGTYSVDELTVADGIGGIFCDGIIKGQGTASVAVIVLGSAGNPVTNAKFVLRMDQSSGDLRAVQGYDTSFCSFVDCFIYGFVNSPTLNHYGFWMQGPCINNIWANNNIQLYDQPTQDGFGIALYGTVGTGLPFGGFFAGVVSRAQYPAVGNTISGNAISYGSYAVSIQASDYNSVTGNTCLNQNRRCVYFANASFGNTVSGNVFKQYLATAVLLGYGSSNNTITGNYCETTIIAGEATININTGSQGNLISANKIYASTNYGVYIATDSINNSVIGNDIGQHYLAAIAVENDWESPRPTNAIFSRPNYGAPPSPYTAWSYIDMTGVAITDNVIRAGYAGRATAAIYVAQITAAGNTKTSNITVSGNTVISSDNITYNLYLFEETTGFLTDLQFTTNDFHTGNTEVSANTSTLAASWNDKISYFSGNNLLDIDIASETINFADGDTSPNVAQNSNALTSRLFTFTNTSPTDVTYFDGGFANQTIAVRLNSSTTIKYNAAFIRTRDLLDIVGSSTSQIVSFIRVNTVWIETWRNF